MIAFSINSDFVLHPLSLYSCSTFSYVSFFAHNRNLFFPFGIAIFPSFFLATLIYPLKYLRFCKAQAILPNFRNLATLSLKSQNSLILSALPTNVNAIGSVCNPIAYSCKIFCQLFNPLFTNPSLQKRLIFRLFCRVRAFPLLFACHRKNPALLPFFSQLRTRYARPFFVPSIPGASQSQKRNYTIVNSSCSA